MELNAFWQAIVDYAVQINFWELTGLITGLLAVIFLIKENILTWPFGIAYVFVSFAVFWEAQLYGDFLLHVFFLILNIYGWWFWVKGKKQPEEPVQVTRMTIAKNLKILGITVLGIFIFAQLLLGIPQWFVGASPASLPYWDSTTSILSVTGMYLTARKKIENWYYWLAVDVLATGIYFYKELYFYTTLYLVYIVLAFLGYLAWKKNLKTTAC